MGFVNLWGRSFKLQLGSADAKRDAQMLGAVLGAAKGGGPRGAAHAATWGVYEAAQSARLAVMYREAGLPGEPPHRWWL